MTDPTETGARDLAARIEDALRGTTPIDFDEKSGILGEVDENGVFRVWEQPVFTLRNIALIVAAPGLLREALARIEADAATIKALREANANQAETIRKMLDRLPSTRKRSIYWRTATMPDLTPEQEQDIDRFIARLTQFEAGEIEECPYCGATVKSMQKVGRCVYSHPCGCRLWQGEIPPAWQKKQEVRHAK